MKSVDDTTGTIGHVTHLECLNCGEKYPLEKLKSDQGTTLENVCYDACMGPLDVRYDYGQIKELISENVLRRRPDTLYKLKELLPVNEILAGKDLSYTPLVRSKEIGDELGIELYYKLDSETAYTGSFKDRPVALAFNKALEAGYENVFVASTGNLAISSAYYAKKYGIACRVYVPKSLGEVKKDAIRQYLSSPKDLIEYDGNYDETNVAAISDCEKANEAEIKELGRRKTFVPNSGFRPYYKEGSKTSGTEIALQVKEKTESDINLVYPLGSGALFCSAYKGINELKKLDLFSNDVRMWGAQPEDCSPVIDAIPSGVIAPLKKAETIAKSIAIGNPGSGYQALSVIKDSRGGGWKVSEKEIFQRTLDLYYRDDIFSQFVGGVTLAGISRGVARGDLKEGSVVVANITGTGRNRIEDDLLEYGKRFGLESEAKGVIDETRGYKLKIRDRALEIYP